MEIDFSFNETTCSAEEFTISQGHTLQRYSVVALVAEKFRALLQQKGRNRYRGQDLYDLLLLIRQIPNQLCEIKPQILEALLESSRSRNLEPEQGSMDEIETIKMTSHEYDLLEDTIEGALEEFDTAYAEVMRFYQSLPWGDN